MQVSEEMQHGSKWRKLKLAPGLDTCVHIPRTFDDSTATARFSGSVSPTVVSPAVDTSNYLPSTPTPSSSGLRCPFATSAPVNLPRRFRHTTRCLTGDYSHSIGCGKSLSEIKNSSFFKFSYFYSFCGKRCQLELLLCEAFIAYDEN
ncbi:hypothetical protein VNO80_24794 [Phaseolus coccineus]|uniref:Uncharacterized protein n=1 Tax=Phaseolus coccineus TaxID=3886 RepID=A0AAN9QN62_PHACN